MPYRAIQHVLPAVPIDMGGMAVKQPLPHADLDRLDPFLLLHHARVRLAPGGRPEALGVPPHPHRGFEPVTFIYRGGVHHRDSLGNDSVIAAGGVQWMTAGRGVVHSERPPRRLAEEGGEQEIIQLWVNLPARFKMMDPRYQGLAEADLPVFTADADRVQVRVVAGALGGVAGPVETMSPVLAANAAFEAEGRFLFEVPADYQAFLYLLDGRVRVNDAEEAAGEHLVAFAAGEGGIDVEALAATRLLLMAGAPLNEPVAASGPFVMNRSVEIFHAMQDYQEGRMGTLEERF